MHNSTYACLSRSNGANQPSSDQEGVDRQNSLMFTKLPLPKLENDLQSYNLRLDSRAHAEQNKGKCTHCAILLKTIGIATLINNMVPIKINMEIHVAIRNRIIYDIFAKKLYYGRTTKKYELNLKRTHYSRSSVHSARIGH